jgi:hypothetical protein
MYNRRHHFWHSVLAGCATGLAFAPMIGAATPALSAFYATGCGAFVGTVMGISTAARNAGEREYLRRHPALWESQNTTGTGSAVAPRTSSEITLKDAQGGNETRRTESSDERLISPILRWLYGENYKHQQRLLYRERASTPVLPSAEAANVTTTTPQEPEVTGWFNQLVVKLFQRNQPETRATETTTTTTTTTPPSSQSKPSGQDITK